MLMGRQRLVLDWYQLMVRCFIALKWWSAAIDEVTVAVIIENLPS
jgi:hypothetical protein